MVQVCSEDVWRGVVSSPTPKPSEGGNDPPLNVSILASGTTLSVEWTGRDSRSWHQVVCSNGRQTFTTLEEGGFGVSITGAQPNTTYSCCVSCLGISTRMVYTSRPDVSPEGEKKKKKGEGDECVRIVGFA